MSLSEEQILTLHKTISQFRSLQETLPQQLQELRDILSTQQQQISLINSKLNNTHDDNVLCNIKVKSPSQFDGKQPGQCNTFFSQLAVYFAANNSYNTDEKKIMFAISCISGPAFTFMEPFVARLGSHPKPDILTNYDTFKANITNAFGDSDPIITAETQLRRLRQDNTTVSIYATRFRMYAQAVKWNDAALISQFKINLSKPIQQELARRPTSTNLESLIFDAIEIDNKLFKESHQGESATNNHTQNNAPMDLDPPSTSRISQEERDRRIQTKSCLYCGDTSHFKKYCPKITTNNHQSLNTFVLNCWSPSTLCQPGFHDLPQVEIISDTAKSTHVKIAHTTHGLLFIPVVFGGFKIGQFTRIQALLDTGASTSVVTQDLVDFLQLSHRTTPTSGTFIVGNGQATTATSRLNTRLRISSSIFHSECHDFYVVKNCSFSIILGLDWIRKHGVFIDFSNRITEIKCPATMLCCPDKPSTSELLGSDPIDKNSSLDCPPSPAPSFHSIDNANCNTTLVSPAIGFPAPEIVTVLNKTTLSLSTYASGSTVNTSHEYLPSSLSRDPMLPTVNTTVMNVSQALPPCEPTSPSSFQDFLKVLPIINVKRPISHYPGKQNGSTDALSRRDKPVREGGDALSKTTMTLIAPIQSTLTAMPQVPRLTKSSETHDTILQSLSNDTHHWPRLKKYTKLLLSFTTIPGSLQLSMPVSQQ